MQSATNALRNDKRFTTLAILSERDVNPIGTLTQLPALWVRGGTLIEKSLCVLGNIYCGGFIVGNVCSDVLLADAIHEKNPGQGINIYDDLILQQDSSLFANNIQVLTINGAGFCPDLTANVSVGDTLSWNGSQYCPMAPIQLPIQPIEGGTGLTSYNAGDLLVATGNVTLTTLPIGFNGQILVANSGTPTWETPTSGITLPITEVQGGTNIVTYVQGDTIYASGVNVLTKLPIGSSGQVMTVSGGVPTWANSASAGVTTVNTGVGLMGGPITTTGTVSLANTSVVPGSYGSASQSPSYTVDGQGRLTAAANVSINHNALLNYVANQHVDHSTVSINAGTGLSGGGDITTTRTLNLANTAVTAASYTWTNLTVDAQGRLTAASSNATPVTSFATTLSGLTTNMSTGAVSLGGTLNVVAGGTGGSAYTAGGVIYGNGALALGASAAGTAGQLLISGGAGSPTWTSSPTVTNLTVTNTIIYTNGIEIGDVTTSTSGGSGLAIGKGATTTADDAIAIGSGATSVGIAIGNDAHTGTGTFNTIVGNIAGNVFMTADNCTALGHGALGVCTDGYEQTAVGAYALALNTSGYRNTAIGYNALAVTDIGDSNVAVGHSALAANTNGYEQVAIGWKALFSSSGSVFNVAVGAEALQNSINDQNTAVGRRALRLSTGSNNTALGCYAMQNMLNANNNVGMGYFAGGTLTTGNDNVLIGDQVDVTASSVTTAVAVGKLAVVADSGVAIGQGATLNAAATSGIAIGKGANLTSAATGGAIALGASITANEAGGFFVQHRGPLAVTVNAAGFIAGTNELIEVTSSRRFKENIRDLESVSEKIDRFRPVRYNAKPGHGDNREHIGLIAEEVEEIFPEFVTYDGEGQVTGMMFDRVVSLLIKEIQEMRQRIKILETA